MKADFETICDEIKSILSSGLNTRLGVIDSEKDDGIELKEINSNAYFFQDLNGVTINYNPFLFYGLINVEGEGDLGHTPAKLEIFVAVAIEDRGEDISVSRRLFRYQRAVRELLEEGFDSLPSGAKMSVQSQVPVELRLMNTSFAHRAIGVIVTVDLGF